MYETRGYPVDLDVRLRQGRERAHRRAERRATARRRRLFALLAPRSALR